MPYSTPRNVPTTNEQKSFGKERKDFAEESMKKLRSPLDDADLTVEKKKITMDPGIRLLHILLSASSMQVLELQGLGPRRTLFRFRFGTSLEYILSASTFQFLKVLLHQRFLLFTFTHLFGKIILEPLSISSVFLRANS